eukprot:jgi/Mesvir1/17838/Mv12926-RA.1
MELTWPQRAVQSAEFPLKSFVFDCGGLRMNTKYQPEGYECILANVWWPLSYPFDPNMLRWRPDDDYHGPTRLFVTMPTGKTERIFVVDQTATVKDAKCAIQAVTGVYPEHQQLTFSGQQLDDDERTLADYKIKNRSKLHVVFIH